MICGACFGAYDSSNVTHITGGYGYASINSGAAGAGNTFAQPLYRFGSTATMTRFRGRFWTSAGGTISSAKLYVLSGASSPYTVRSTTDITTEMNAAITTNHFELDITGLSLPVLDGWFVAVYLSDKVNFVTIE